MVHRVCDSLSVCKAEEGMKSLERRNVMVGIRFDAQAGELLSWAILKVADPGDQVIALHVCKQTGEALKEHMLLDDLLDSYRDLCRIKKIDLVGKIPKGNSIRKSLVKEATICSALSVVVGTSNQAALRGWLSPAKYCTKHLPPSIEVLGIHNGKLVFRRGISIAGPGEDPRPSINRFVHQSSSMNKIHEEAGDSAKETPSLVGTESHPTSFSFTTYSNLEQKKPGWPLLRRSSISSHAALTARKMSVVQWVMSMPSRSPHESLVDTPDRDSWSFCFRVLGSPLRGIGDSPDSRSISQSFWGEKSEFDEGGLSYSTVSPSHFTCFSYEVLKNSTSQFSPENLIGKGGCSRVYKGRFPDGRPVAVKVTKPSKATWKDFSLEIDIISSLKHKNITPLLGVCIENSKLISVYECMSNGSLEDNLHSDKGDRYVLPWETRFKIAVKIADALNYLHNGFSRSVIHRDVKSSNILLSYGFEPQLSDFGLAVWGPTNSSSETYDDVVGTFGYLAPEYFMYGKVSDKIDVYSFGVVLLELLSGKKPIDSSKEQEILVMWAKPILQSGKLNGIVDPKLKTDYNERQMQRMILAATLCLTRSPQVRPRMNEILKLLRGEESIEKWTNSYKVEEDTYSYDEASRKAESLMRVDVEDDDMTSMSSSMEQSRHTSLEDYLRGRWSRSSSFD